ncbi:MAG: LuxR family transcriptional regulator [Rhodobacteraceae bacterium]|nr:LuxR family transcriptional regulator [Paracoccaceae bacterium]
MTWVQSFLDRLESTTSLESVQSLIESVRDELGVAHAVYHLVGGTGREYGAMTYDPDWVEHYKSERYFNVDPVVLGALRTTAPLDWQALDWTDRASRTLLGEAVAGGVGKQGISVPIRGVGGQMAMFSVTSYENGASWGRFGCQHVPNLVLAGNYIHQQAARIMGADQLAASPDLSPRERDVLTFLAVGHSRAAAADKLGISEHTLRAYLDTARLKLGAQNTTHAVALAMTRGLLLP